MIIKTFSRLSPEKKANNVIFVENFRDVIIISIEAFHVLFHSLSFLGNINSLRKKYVFEFLGKLFLKGFEK